MDKKTKYWILLSISQASKERGYNVVQLYNSRPDFVKEALNGFFGLLNQLSKENLVELNNKLMGQNYQLTRKGEKELNSYLRKSGMFEYMSFIKLIPEFEIKYRLKLIESFIGNLVAVALLSFIQSVLTINNIKINYISIIIVALIMVAGIIIILSGFLILFNFLYLMLGNISNKLKNLVRENYSSISLFLVILILFITVISSIIYYKNRIEDFLIPFIIAIIILVISNFNKVRSFVDGVIKKYLKVD